MAANPPVAGRPGVINPGLAGNQAGMRELVQRLIFVLVALLAYRIGTHVPVPGIDPNALQAMFDRNQGGVLDLANMFSGGALERMSVLALGVMPYITASIVMNLMTVMSPELDKMRKNEGEAGRRKITQYTRYGAAGIGVVQGLALSATLVNQGITYFGGVSFFVVATLCFLTGTMFLMWLGEQITERGVGNGISLIIFAGIVAGFPAQIFGSFETARQGGAGDLVALLVALIMAVFVVAAVVYIERAQRRITVNYAKRQQGRQQMQPQSSHLPLKINQAGVIPAIFASSLLLAPASITQWLGQSPGTEWLQEVSLALGPGQPLYVLLFAGGIIFFSFFYTALVFNPKDIADNLRRQGAYLPGIRPGASTAKYIDDVATRLTMFGAIYVTIVCLLPEFMVVASSVTFQLGGTALLIVVVVGMDFMSQIQQHLMSSRYAKLMERANLGTQGSKSGRK